MPECHICGGTPIVGFELNDEELEHPEAPYDMYTVFYCKDCYNAIYKARVDAKMSVGAKLTL